VKGEEDGGVSQRRRPKKDGAWLGLLGRGFRVEEPDDNVKKSRGGRPGKKYNSQGGNKPSHVRQGGKSRRGRKNQRKRQKYTERRKGVKEQRNSEKD